MIQRDLHTHHYVHRILPVVDVQTLPARHFVSSSHDGTEQGLVEVLEHQVPGRTAAHHKHWHLSTRDNPAPVEPLAPAPMASRANTNMTTASGKIYTTGDEGEADGIDTVLSQHFREGGRGQMVEIQEGQYVHPSTGK